MGCATQLQAAYPDVPVHAGTAEQIPLDDDSVDAVLVGQAFHWFDHDAALDEIARVLRPGGVLGLLWNIRDDSIGWVAELTGTLVMGADVLVAGGRIRLGERGGARAVRPDRAPRLPQPDPV